MDITKRAIKRVIVKVSEQEDLSSEEKEVLCEVLRVLLIGYDKNKKEVADMAKKKTTSAKGDKTPKADASKKKTAKKK